MIVIFGLVLGVMSNAAYAVTNKISANFSSGSVLVGPNSDTCASGLAGAIRYMSGSPGTLAWCDGVTASWVTLGAGGAAAGSNTNVQFNSGGSALGGVAGFTYDLTNNIMATTGPGTVRAGNGTVTAPSHSFSAGGISGPSLLMSTTADTSPVNLTFFNATDWAYWGGSNGTPSQRKSGGGSLIGTATLISAAGWTTYNDDARGFSWSDGTPTGSGFSQNGIYDTKNAGGTTLTGGGYSLTFPADTSPREVRIYMQVYSGTATITATLSDGSASSVVNTISAGANNSNQGTVVVGYTAGSASQTLTVSVVLSAANYQYANATLNAATMKVLSTAATGTGMWMSGANTALDFSVGGVSALQLGTVASGINYLRLIPSVSGTAPIVTSQAFDINPPGSSFAITGKTATAAGAGGPITVTGGAGSGSGAGGAIVLSTSSPSWFGDGGAMTLAAGNGGSTSGAGGTVTLTAGTVTSGTAGTILGKIGSSTYMTVQTPSTTSSSVVFNGSDAMIVPAGSQAQRPSTGVNGMLRYNSSLSSLETYQAGAWTRVIGTVTSLGDLTDAKTNYSGTVNSSTNSIYSILINDTGGPVASAGAGYNTGIGYKALSPLTTGVHNSALGYQALMLNTTGSNNTSIGAYSGNSITTKSDTTMIGDDTGINVNGSKDTSVFYALCCAVNDENTGVGSNLGAVYPTQSTLFGFGGGGNNPSYNTDLGNAGSNRADNVSYATCAGGRSVCGNYDSHAYSVILGDYAASTGGSPNYSVYYSFDAGRAMTSGNYNIFMINNYNMTTATNAILIGDTGSNDTPVNTVDLGGIFFASTGAGNYLKIDANQHMNVHTTLGAPTQNGTGCGNASYSATGNDNMFKITTGTTAATTCAITFASAWTIAPICVISPAVAETAALTTVSTTGVTITFSSSTASRPFTGQCRAYY